MTTPQVTLTETEALIIIDKLRSAQAKLFSDHEHKQGCQRPNNNFNRTCTCGLFDLVFAIGKIAHPLNMLAYEREKQQTGK